MCLVTGGTSGIGNAIADGFAKAGAAVTITGTRAGADDYDIDLSGFGYRQCQMAEHVRHRRARSHRSTNSTSW